MISDYLELDFYVAKYDVGQQDKVCIKYFGNLEGFCVILHRTM